MDRDRAGLVADLDLVGFVEVRDAIDERDRLVAGCLSDQGEICDQTGAVTIHANGRRSRALNEDDIAIVARALRDGNL